MPYHRRQLHLAGFLIAGSVVHGRATWRTPAPETKFLSADYYIDASKIIERLTFDFLALAGRPAVGAPYDRIDESLGSSARRATKRRPIPARPPAGRERPRQQRNIR